MFNIYIAMNMSLILDKFELSQGNSLLGITSICIGGFMGAFFNGFMVKRLKIRKKFKFVFVINSILVFIFFPIINLFLYLNYWFPFIISLFFIGFTLMPLITLSIEYSVQISYPVGEALSAGLVTMTGMFSAPLYNMFSSLFQKSLQDLIVFHIITEGLLLVAICMALLIQEKTHTRDMMETVLKEER